MSIYRRLSLSAASVSVAASIAAGFTLPAYELPVGKKLHYSSRTETWQPHGTTVNTRLSEHWVLAESSGVFRVLLRIANQTYKTDTTGTRTDEPAKTGWGLFELHGDGRLLRDQSTLDFDVTALFPPLPADSAEAASGWQRPDTLVGSVDLFRLENRSLSDSLWLVERMNVTPFDSIYGVKPNFAGVTFDTRRGLPVGRVHFRTDRERNIRSHGTAALDSVTTFDATAISPQVRSLIDYFDVKLAYARLDEQADPNDTNRAPFARTRALLDSPRQRTPDTTVQKLLADDLERHRQSTEYALERARSRLGRIGRPAPAWELADLAGAKHRLADYRGKVVILDWWYKNCPWCILAMPKLDSLAREFKDQPVAVLGMNVDKDQADAQFVVDKLRLGYPNMMASRDLAKKYGVTGYPTLFVLDQQGNTIDVYTGYSPDLEQKLARRIRALLGQ